jgi:hypothetical protein
VGKNENIAPVYKRGSKKEAGNYTYHAVALTSIPCKMMEAMI